MRKLLGESRFDLAWFDFHFATHCNADQRTRNTATRCVLQAHNAAKCHCDRGSANSLAGLRSRFAAGRGKEGEGKGKGGVGQGGMGRGAEGRLTLMRSWNRAAVWLRPALTNSEVHVRHSRDRLCKIT